MQKQIQPLIHSADSQIIGLPQLNRFQANEQTDQSSDTRLVHVGEQFPVVMAFAISHFE